MHKALNSKATLQKEYASKSVCPPMLHPVSNNFFYMSAVKESWIQTSRNSSVRVCVCFHVSVFFYLTFQN